VHVKALAALLLLLGSSVVAAAGAGGAPGGEIFERPLFVAIDMPVNGTAQVTPQLQAVIRAGGSTLTFVQDDFDGGTLVNASHDETGIFPNASGQANESFFESKVFEYPEGARYRWTAPLDIVMSGGSGDVEPLLSVEVRFGGREGARNWTSWADIGLGGDYTAAPGLNNSSLESPAVQYKIHFLEPLNASTPKVTFVGVWYLAPLEAVYVRLGTSAQWHLLGNTPGQYKFNTTLAPGANVLQARAVDTAGSERVATATVSLDNEAPRVADAPVDGAVIPVDRAAEIVFSEPVDTASAASAITIEAPFTVDRVWSADGTRLFVSAAEAPTQGQVTVTVGPALIDAAGNRFNDTRTLHFTMGPGEAALEMTWLLVALFGAGGAVALVALWHGERLREQRKAYAREVAKRMEDHGQGEPAPGAETSPEERP
jgi:hypothetical protein